MLAHTETIDVDRDPEQVYAFIVDATNDVHWRSEVISSELIDGAAGQPGARYRQVMTSGRRESSGIHEIVSTDPPQHIVWRTPPGEGPLEFEGTYSIEPRDGGCQVRLHTVVRPKGVFRLGQPFMRGYLRKVSARYARELKAVVERR